MLRRHVRSDFAADVYVFPGGKVDPGDEDVRLSQFVIGPADVDDAPEGPMWQALRLAAVRELFEEAGVLLASRGAGELVRFTGPDAERFADYRRRLHDGEISLLDLARREGLAYTLDRLHPFSHWITPESFPRRFDTRFYVAYLPEDQEPLHDAVETTASSWISPKTALEEFAAGRFPLVFATQKHLERLARFASVEGMISSISPSDLEPVMPKVVNEAGEQHFLVPGDPGY
jgi:8-oxo-dGTP pyrophosphatase MutT (NUDIX family)